MATKIYLTFVLVLCYAVTYGYAQCPSADWVLNEGKCYLFRVRYNEDMSTWQQALNLCKAETGGAGSLVSILDADENSFVFNTAVSIMQDIGFYMHMWTGLSKKGAGFDYIWEDGQPVTYTNWAAGEPSDTAGTQNCVRMYYFDDRPFDSAKWDDYFCNNYIDDNSDRIGYACKFVPGDTTTLTPPQTTPGGNETTPIQPQYEFTLLANFESVSGIDFDLACTQAYATKMNDRAREMMDLVNSEVGSTLCNGMTTDMMRIASVSAPLSTSGNQGTTTHYYITRIGDNISPSHVETCAREMSDYLSNHNNWDASGGVLPPEDGCPTAVFPTNMFNQTGFNWLCVSENEEQNTILRYGITHLAYLLSVNGTDIDASCLQAHNQQFVIDTVAMSQKVNGLIGTELCVGKSMAIASVSAFLTAAGDVGSSSQTYELEAGPDTLFNEVYPCANEISAYMSDHNNWDSLLPPIDGCPKLTFRTDYFDEDSQQWLCSS